MKPWMPQKIIVPFWTFSTNVPKVHKDLLRVFYRFFIYSFVIVVTSEKKNNCNYNSYRFSYKFAFIFFLSFIANQKQESGFQQVCGLVMRRISVFCFWRVTLYLIAMSNSIDCYKGIFLHVIPVRIIVTCFNLWSCCSSPTIRKLLFSFSCLYTLFEIT